MENLYETPRHVDDPKDCFFYHTMEIPTFGVIRGDWDLRGRVKDYIGGVKVQGKSVLDVGCASGYLTFEMEKMGAKVTSFDADDAIRLKWLPFPNSKFSTNWDTWRVEANAWLEAVKNGYWLAHRTYGSKAKAVYGDVYNMPKDIGDFDVVVVGQILVHLCDPISALGSVARHAKEKLIIAEGSFESREPLAKLLASAESGSEWTWWILSTGLYKELLKILGFEIQSIITSGYKCNHASIESNTVPITTIVSKRVNAGYPLRG